MDDAFAAAKIAYAAELPERGAEIRRALDAIVHELGLRGSPDWARLEQLTHKLAGSGGIYGYPALGALARELEERLYDGSLQDLPAAAAASRLREWYARFVERLSGELSGERSAA